MQLGVSVVVGFLAVLLLCSFGEGQFPCPRSFYRCADGYCLERTRLCDGVAHCRDRSDERDCPKIACYGHSSERDPFSGHCLNCQHGTEGRDCELCKSGYVGDATQPTTNACHPPTRLQRCHLIYMGEFCYRCSASVRYGNPDILRRGYCNRCPCAVQTRLPLLHGRFRRDVSQTRPEEDRLELWHRLQNVADLSQRLDGYLQHNTPTERTLVDAANRLLSSLHSLTNTTSEETFRLRHHLRKSLLPVKRKTQALLKVMSHPA
ncbi:laminin subunit alpha-1-like [Branchiostoma lanceolatum]|uniref:laminin subunit alpha-1-like n=1 Tax=Branchiostoma lanceolatum TaxID=7740 RepID=UPI0034571A85